MFLAIWPAILTQFMSPDRLSVLRLFHGFAAQTLFFESLSQELFLQPIATTPLFSVQTTRICRRGKVTNEFSHIAIGRPTGFLFRFSFLRVGSQPGSEMKCCLCQSSLSTITSLVTKTCQAILFYDNPATLFFFCSRCLFLFPQLFFSPLTIRSRTALLISFPARQSTSHMHTLVIHGIENTLPFTFFFGLNAQLYEAKIWQCV